jgi:membrane fusion protein, multidrug efflux system
MNRKYIIAGVIFVALGVGAFFLLRLIHGSGAAESAGEEQATATVVTVQTGKLQQATLHGYVECFGSVAPAPAEKDQPAASADVASPVAGVITEVKVFEGQHVQQGDLLFQLDSRVANVAVEFAQRTVDRQKELLKMNNTSQKAMQDAEQQLAAARAQQALLNIRASLSGTVTRVNLHAGEAVDLTTVLATITDLDRLVVNADIPAAEASQVRVGQEVELQGDSLTNTSVSFISPGIQASNGMVLVRAPVPKGSDLRPGQFVSLEIVVATHTNCLAAPAESVVKNMDGKEVIAVVSNDEATQVAVKTGLREKGQVEVEAPELKGDETVVTVGAYGLPEKTKVHVQNP